MITIENITKFYKINGKKHYIFKDLSFSLPEGRNIALVGGNGAGKSTLLRILGGIDFPNSGRVITKKSVSWPVALGGGFQGSLSAREGIKFVCRIYGKSDKETQRIIEYVQDFAEIGIYFDQPVSTYSSGMRSKINFGLSMAFDFDIYLVDEAMAVGDGRFRKKSVKAFKEKLGKCNMIMTAHDIQTLKDTCDCAVVLYKGNATFFDKLDEAIVHYDELYR